MGRKNKAHNDIPKLKSDPTEKDFTFNMKQPINFIARNPKQKKAYNSVLSNPITFLIGSVGSGKTTIGVTSALALLMDKNSQYKKIVLLRPVTTSETEQLGFLKGGMEEKIAPLMLPLKNVIEKLIGNLGFMSLVESGKIEPFAINYVEGITYEQTIVLIDEFQNINPSTLKSILTRITDDSKVIVMGDKNQIKLQDPSQSSALDTDRFKGRKGIKVIEFLEEDIVRGEITKLVESCYPKEIKKDNLFKTKTNQSEYKLFCSDKFEEYSFTDPDDLDNEVDVF